MKQNRNFSKGEPVKVETSNGYLWDGEVVEYRRESVPRNGGVEDYHTLLLDMPRHPAREKPNRIGRANINMETAVLSGPHQGKKFDVERIWRAEDL